MAVVINDFEVVAEPPAKAEAADRPDAKDQPDRPGPPDVEQVLRKCQERQARVRAH